MEFNFRIRIDISCILRLRLRLELNLKLRRLCGSLRVCPPSLCLSAGSTSFRSQPFSTCLNGQLQQQHTHTHTLSLGVGVAQFSSENCLTFAVFCQRHFVLPIHFSYRVFKFYYCMCHKRRLVGVLD